MAAACGIEVVWIGKQEEGGGVWYWHRRTRVSTFVLPPLLPRSEGLGIPSPLLGCHQVRGANSAPVWTSL